MEECEEMMRGIPMCSKHEWRPKGGGGGVGGLLCRFRLSDGLTFGWWAFFWWAFVPLPGRIYSKEKLTHFLSRQEPDFFFLSLSLGQFHRGFPVRVMIRL